MKLDPTSYAVVHEKFRLVFWLDPEKIDSPSHAMSLINSFMEDYHSLRLASAGGNNERINPDKFLNLNKNKYDWLTHITIPGIYIEPLLSDGEYAKVLDVVKSITSYTNLN